MDEGTLVKAVFYPPAQALLCYHYFPGAKPTHLYLAGLGPASTCVYPSLISDSDLAAYHTLMPDFLGFGYSDRPDDFGYTIDEHADSIAYLLNQLQVTGCTVIGTSMGGAVAVTLATQHPNLVSKLVLAEGVLDGLDVFGIASQSEEQYIARGHRVVMEWFRQLRPPYDPTERGWLPVVKLTPPHAFYRTAVSLAKGAQPSWREQFFRLRIPRLYLWGDENFRREDTEAFVTHGVEVAVIPHAGHAMYLDNPAAFVHAIAEFSAR